MSKTTTKSTSDNQASGELIILIESQLSPQSIDGTIFSTSANEDINQLSNVLSKSGAKIIPLFGPENRIMDNADVAEFTAASGIILSEFYTVETNENKESLAKELLDQPGVLAAYVKPKPQPPVLEEKFHSYNPPSPTDITPPTTPNYQSRQVYLDAAPAGVDAHYAHTLPGGKGDGIRIIDIEGAWRFTHEDLLFNQGGVIAGDSSTEIRWRNHGTAVIGTFGGDENNKGILGISPNAQTRAISIFGPNNSSSKAIKLAADALSAGDIILIELHAAGPFANDEGQFGYIAMEWWPDDFAAIRYATNKGIIVVEAAGNGSQNLDASGYNTRPEGFPTTWRNPFNLANPQSGAILVGAGAPPPGTHGRNHGAARSRLDFSNYGARIDAQGWGAEVTTAGYGNLQGGGNENYWYTDTFNGTSSASPIVVGALACIQGRLKNRSKALLTPATARNILRTTGSPQQSSTGFPVTQRIGNLPNLKEAFASLGVHQPILKHNTKEMKDNIKEVKEIKEFKEKDFKELKELEKRIEKNPKELREKLKETFDDFNISQPDQQYNFSLEERLNKIETAIEQIYHFISSDNRPDLRSHLEDY